MSLEDISVSNKLSGLTKCQAYDRKYVPNGVSL